MKFTDCNVDSQILDVKVCKPQVVGLHHQTPLALMYFTIEDYRARFIVKLFMNFYST